MLFRSAKMGSERVKTLPPGVFVQHLFKPSIQGGDVDYPLVSESIAVLFITPDWTVVYLNFLVDQNFPAGADEVLQRQIKRRCKGYTVINGSCINAVYPEFFSDAFRQKKDGKSCKKFMLVIADIMLNRKALSIKHSEQDFSGLQPRRTPNA